jgi:hypothetical protein
MNQHMLPQSQPMTLLWPQNAGAHAGVRVISSGRVDEPLTDRTLVMTDAEQRTRADMLVLVEPSALISSDASTPNVGGPPGVLVDPSDAVTISGVVHESDRRSMPEDLSIVLDEELFAGWQGRPTFVADRLDLHLATLGRASDGAHEAAQTRVAR